MKVSAIIVTRGDRDLTPILESLPVGWEVIIWDNGAGVVTLHQVDFGHLPIPPKGETITVTKMTDPGHLGRFAAVVPLDGQPDLSVYGRYAAIQHATSDLIFTQDDDVIVSDPQAIVDALECDACSGTGAWTGWSGDDEYTQEGGCESCEGTGYNQDILVANQPQEFRHDGYTDSCLVGFGACFHRDAPMRAFDRYAENMTKFMPPGPVDYDALVGWFRRTCDVVFTTLTPRVLVDVPKVNREFAEDESRMYRQKGHVEERARMLELARKVRDGC